MLDKSVRILNFDASLTRQKKLIAEYNPRIIDLTDIGPEARLWMNLETKKKVINRLSGSRKNTITFIGSGDFHHTSAILTEQLSEPFCLFVFDFHPDWDTLPPRLGCGSWVTQALKNKNILKCLLFGPSSDDLSFGWCLQSANFSSLKNNRTEIYPYAHKPSRVFLKNIPFNTSIKTKKFFLGAKIYWNELENSDWEGFFNSIIQRLPAKQVYLSIDKDCLRKEYAITNWEEGRLSLEGLLSALKIIKENTDIIGVDIAGDYSRELISGRWKRFLSELDHPKDIPARGRSPEEIDAINQETNLKIIETLMA